MSQAELYDLLRGRGAVFHRGRYLGVVTAKVTENVDPEELGRIKVRFPWLRDEVENSHWVRIANKLGGKNFGFWTMPDIDDEVLIAFEHGDLRFPYMIGTLWSQASQPPIVNDVLCKDCLANPSHIESHDDERNRDGANRFRFIRSRNGNTLVFDDSRGKGRGGLSLMDGTGRHRLDIVTEQAKIEVLSADGDVNFSAPNGDVFFAAQAIEIEAEEILGISAEETARFDSKLDTQVSALGSLSIRSQNSLHLRTPAASQVEALGGMFCLAKTQLEVASTGSTALQATGAVQVKGATTTMAAPGLPVGAVALEEQHLNELLSEILESINQVILDMSPAERDAMLGVLTNFPGQDPALLESAKPALRRDTRDLSAPGRGPAHSMLCGPACPSCGVPAQFVCANPQCQEEAGRDANP